MSVAPLNPRIGGDLAFTNNSAQFHESNSKGVKAMVQRDDDVRFEPTRPGVFAEQAFEAPNSQYADVRSTVEHQFTLMEQAHDRIRAEELAARLRERLAS